MAKGRKGLFVSNLFSGVTSCAYCLGTMRYENKGLPPKGSSYLVCQNSSRGLCDDAIRWRYDDFETSFLSFVSEIDLEQVLSETSNQSQALQIEAQLKAIDGRIQILEKREAAIFETMELMSRKDAAAQQLDDLADQLDALRARREEKVREQASHVAGRTQFVESKAEIKPLLARIRKSGENRCIPLASAIGSKNSVVG